MKQTNKMLYESVADEIAAMITVEKKYTVGDQIPTEMELAEGLGVSRNTVREAVRLLVQSGVLEIRRGKGTFVGSNTSYKVNGAMDQVMSAQLEIKDLYEARLSVEPRSTYYAAKRASPAELKRIEAYCNEVLERIRQGDNREEAEVGFHSVIAKASKNDFFVNLIPVINLSLTKALRIDQNSQAIELSTTQDYPLIVEFLLKRDATSAEYAMRNHIARCMSYLGIPIE